MANNVPITPGSGANIATDEVTDGVLGTVQVQYLKIMDGTDNGTNRLTVTSGGAAKVDGSGVTQPISGSISITQGGNTASVNPSGLLYTSLQSGNGGVLDFLGQNTSGTFSALAVGGQYNTTPTTMTSGRWSPLQLSSAARLLVDGSGVTQPISTPMSAFSSVASWTSATSVNTTVTLGSGSGNTYPNLCGQLTQGSTITGGAVTFEESFDNGATWVSIPASRLIDPSSGATIANPYTLVASTNKQYQIITSGTSSVRLKLSTVITGTATVTISLQQASFPSTIQVFQNTAANLKVDLSGTAANATAIKVDGSGVTQPVSVAASVTVAQATSSNLKAQVDPLTAASWGIGTSTQNSASATNGHLALGQYNTSPTAITSGNMSPLQLNNNGALKVDASAYTVGVSGLQANSSDAMSTTTTNVASNGYLFGWNGATWDRLRGDTTNGLWVNVKATVTQAVQGDVASGTSDSGNPMKVGGIARTSLPTAVTTGQRVNSMYDKSGRQVVVGAQRELKGVQKTSITTASETTVVTAGAAGVFNDVYAIVVTNKSATSVFVDFKDATAGTTRMTLAAPANDTRGFTVAVDSAMVQAVAANNWTATVSSGVTSIEITMLYTQNQ